MFINTQINTVLIVLIDMNWSHDTQLYKEIETNYINLSNTQE